MSELMAECIEYMTALEMAYGISGFIYLFFILAFVFALIIWLFSLFGVFNPRIIEHPGKFEEWTPTKTESSDVPKIVVEPITDHSLFWQQAARKSENSRKH